MKISAQLSTSFQGVKKRELILFTKHLSVMAKAGVSLSQSLHSIADNTESSQLKNVLYAVVGDVENGSTLAKSLAKHPKVFNQFYVSLVEIGEHSGTLEQNLHFLATQLSKEQALRQKIQAALLYPALVVFSAIIMGGFIAFFVLPQLVSFFEALTIELPLPTRILLGIATLFENYGIFIVGSVIAGVTGFNILISIDKVKPYWHVVLLRLPLLGKLFKYTELTRLWRNFGIMLKSGIPIVDSLEASGRTLGNSVYQQHVQELHHALQKGNGIGKTLLEKKYFTFPTLVGQMLAVGEKTGDLEETALYIGDYFEEEIDVVSKNLTTVLEPLLLISIGLGVAFIALAIISPIYELSGSIR